MGIPKKGNQYLLGKRDYFGLVISLRYLLPQKDFLAYKKALSRLIKSYSRNSKRIPESNLLAQMVFPSNWEKIARYKL